MGHRPDLNALTIVERTNLVNLILPYLTDAVVAAHTTINHSGEHLFTGHRAYIEDLEAYLLANGGSQFVPLSKWNPANPIPEEFNVVKAEDDSTPRPPLENLNPNMPLPSKFAEPMLCEYKDADTLGSDVSGWHGNVHTMVGGTMGQFSIASAAPIFWCFHAFVDEIYYDWQHCLPMLPIDTHKWAAVVQIIFGVTNDGGGLGITPGGKPIPIDPWGPLRQLAPAKRDILLGLALSEMATIAHSDVAHENIKKLGVKVIGEGMEQLRR
jgi:Common central domain of tyrosinase